MEGLEVSLSKAILIVNMAGSVIYIPVPAAKLKKH